jgi:hypothetical protein
MASRQEREKDKGRRGRRLQSHDSCRKKQFGLRFRTMVTRIVAFSFLMSLASWVLAAAGWERRAWSEVF